MAERRMFAKSIIDSDVFLDMALSTQALYFHLSMRADDDGFINNPKKIMRMIGASQNELELLIAKRYLLVFDSGVVVIKHWKIHNYIQSDRYKPSLYTEEKQQLITKGNKSYTESDTKCIQDGYAGKVRLGKVSQGKASQEKEEKPKKDTPPKHKYGEYKHVLLTDDQRDRLISDWGQSVFDAMVKELDEGLQLKDYGYKDHNLALRKWKEKRNQSKPGSKQVYKHGGEINFEL